MTRQKIISSYLRQVKKNCPFSFRKRLITELESHLSDYLEANPGKTLEDVINYLGSPEKIAEECFLAMEETSRQKIRNKNKWTKRILLAGISIVVLITTCTAVYTLVKISESRVYYIQETIVTENGEVTYEN